MPPAYNVLLSTAGNSASGLEAYERFVRNQVADGALVVETAVADSGGKLLSRQKYPFVQLGYGNDSCCAYYVHADDQSGARAATCHLIEQGHRRIGIINGPAIGAVNAMAQRLTGYHQALQEAGIEFDPVLMVSGDYTRASGQLATEKLFTLANPPTAIFAFNDRMAMGAYGP
jgi:DNA-binding LacI/PurR family transcriptional regulator